MIVTNFCLWVFLIIGGASILTAFSTMFIELIASYYEYPEARKQLQNEIKNNIAFNEVNYLDYTAITRYFIKRLAYKLNK